MSRTITIATRGSALALWQAEHLKARLLGVDLSLTITFNVITTQGDKILDVPLAKVGGKGLFVKEIEQALIDGTADIAVHSMKDVPAELEAGLVLSAVSTREVPWDALCDWMASLGWPIETQLVQNTCRYVFATFQP